MSDRYKGAILSPTAPTVIPQSAGGVYTLSQQLQYQGQGVWPSAVNYPITKSLRFRSSASAYLSRTQTAGSQTTWTWSGWVKRGKFTTSQYFMQAGGSSGSGVTMSVIADDFQIETGNGSTQYYARSTAQYRDPSAWYHVVMVCNTTSATSTLTGTTSDRLQIWVNGVQLTSFSASSIPTQNFAGYINQNSVAANIGRWNGSTPNYYFDGYLAEVNFIDGQALTPSSFGTTDAYGIWQPIRYSGTYGTNGFYLPFTNTTSTSTLGNDFSGNSNTWTVNNISLTSGSTYDSMTDVPTNTNSNTANYCVLNTLDGANTAYITVSNANLTYTEPANANGWRAIRGTIGVTSGKYRFSVYGTIGASTRMQLGLCTSATDLGGYNTSQNIGVQYNPYDAEVTVNGSTTSYGSTQRITAVFDFIFDAATGKCWVAVNGTLLGGNPDAGTGQMATFTTTSPVFPVTQAYGSSWDVNFGQRPWDYTIATASGFYPLNTYNLPTPTILDGDQYMDAITRNGFGTSGGSVATNFQADLIWEKPRNIVQSHYIVDSVRGITSGTAPFISSNSTSQEQNANWYNAPTPTSISFNSNDWGTSTTLVDWIWRAGGSAGVSNTQGTITSTVSANTTAGFSIATYTGNGSNSTVGHGLGVAPSMVIVKQRNTAQSWCVWHTSIGSANVLFLNSTSASTSYSTLFNSMSTLNSTVFSIGTDIGTNQNTGTYVAYCFAQVAGYSAFGSYTGNGSSDGPFVYLGFRPRYVLIKRTNTTGDWIVYDSARSTYNGVASEIYPNLSNAEDNSSIDLDFVSNGIKLRNSGFGVNGSGDTYIYACFAENPFKIANAR